VAILAFPIGIVHALRITAIAARPLSTAQTLIPTVQLRVFVIVSASAIDRKERQHGSENNERCIPKAKGGDPIQAEIPPIPGEGARIGTVYASEIQNRSEVRNNGCAHEIMRHVPVSQLAFGLLARAWKRRRGHPLHHGCEMRSLDRIAEMHLAHYGSYQMVIMTASGRLARLFQSCST
jgi:hypothetical protein